MNERYLWIDTLCLIGDDPEDLLQGIRAMDIIYEQSVLTIIAASGTDASAGLPGVQLNSRKAKQAVEEVRPGIKLMLTHTLRDYLGRSKYSSRGWT